MKLAVLVCALLLLGGCIADRVGNTTDPAASTSSRRSRDPDEPRQMCGDTSISGESRTVCY